MTPLALDSRGILLLAALSLPVGPAAPPRATEGQLGAKIRWIEVPGSEGTLFYMAQRTRDGRLLLTPNEAFFPGLGLAATGEGATPDVDNLNGGKSFTRIERWDRDDSAEWAIYVESPGDLTLRVWMTASDDRGKFILRCGDTRTEFTTVATNDSPTAVAEVTWTPRSAGKQHVRVTCHRSAQQVALHRVEVSGPGAQGASVLRKRWRPKAAHAKFTSSKVSGDVRLWVMEMDARPGDLGFYSPMTTPFGYFGPSWAADGTPGSNLNFSLWSYKRGADEPPVEQLSHLLAVGERSASFGGFGHEGTGVKVRDWQPLAGRQTQRQALALRVEPGPKYDTYTSYFYATDEKRWRLFGVGNKYHRGKSAHSLRIGSFVEVPGRPHVQRTGAYERVMRYRGWVMDAEGQWHALDRMSTGNVHKETKLTHTQRGVDGDGRFYLQTGGWEFRRPTGAKAVQLERSPRADMARYLSPKDIAALTTVPCAATVTTLERTTGGLSGIYQVRNAADDAAITLFWGTQDSLTFADRWQHSVPLEAPGEGENPFTLQDVPDDASVFVRLLLENDQGRFWSSETAVLPGDCR